jgi:hypothetical protein
MGRHPYLNQVFNVKYLQLQFNNYKFDVNEVYPKRIVFCVNG